MTPGVPRNDKNIVWETLADENGLVHWRWRRLPYARWWYLCDFGDPLFASMHMLAPPTAPITCFWCLSVENTL